MPTVGAAGDGAVPIKKDPMLQIICVAVDDAYSSFTHTTAKMFS